MARLRHEKARAPILPTGSATDATLVRVLARWPLQSEGTDWRGWIRSATLGLQRWRL